VNPSSGDELQLTLHIQRKLVKQVRFTGEGCAISQSSASMMTEAIKGKTLEQALDLTQKFKDMIHGKPPHDDLGDLASLKGIAKLHARVKCATLAWVALEEAVKKTEDLNKSEP
ncbi:MAG: SUF system NifU family Fe-S cluster assembly protein, partial [Deinococcota bacterium]|nr:SUF system NifU family Fe-S cluster assembly protein [Deinococcota bacterium]